MRNIKLVTLEEEIKLIHTLGDKLLQSGYNASNSVIVCVSTDYSSIVSQILRHHLSFGGEVCDGFGIDVPYPDEVWNKTYMDEMYENCRIHIPKSKGKALIFVEAGVIRGGNYTHIIDWVKRRVESNKKLVTLTLFENIHSVFKSDFVGDYYNDEIEDLTFWWERENRHWK